MASAPGRGATFTLRLPLVTFVADEPPAAPTVVLPGMPPAARDANAEAMLIVDDEETVRETLVLVLRRITHSSVACADGPAVLAELARVPRSRPVTLFVDLTMPGMDGVEVTRRARALRSDVRIVLMSGHLHSWIEGVARDLAPDGVLTKPFTQQDVAELLRNLEVGRSAATGTTQVEAERD